PRERRRRSSAGSGAGASSFRPPAVARTAAERLRERLPGKAERTAAHTLLGAFGGFLAHIVRLLLAPLLGRLSEPLHARRPHGTPRRPRRRSTPSARGALCSSAPRAGFPEGHRSPVWLGASGGSQAPCACSAVGTDPCC